MAGPGTGRDRVRDGSTGRDVERGVQDMSGLITIGIPARGRPSLLQAMRSCLEQDYRPLEIDVRDTSQGDEVGRLLRALPGVRHLRRFGTARRA